ncbi:histidine kinase [Corynebacterium sp. USCH3]|uniref:sensor histidine kinase n=1 Tax=Corynebacterium sp. USCH3 TaxID=3024840 RepID=UPI0030B36668
MNASLRTPHRPRRLLPLLRASRVTRLGVVETVLAVALTLVEPLETPGTASTGAVVVALLTLVLVAGAARFPVAASMLSLLLVLSTFITDGTVPLYSIFFTMLIVEIVAASGQILLAGSLALAHWALSAVDPQAGTVSTDVAALTIVALVLAAAHMIGWSRASHRRQQEKLRASLAAHERQQRLELARELHDSVATSLTSVVMQAQALTLLPSAGGDTDGDAGADTSADTRHRGLESISETSRTALSNLRTMLQLLNERPDHPSFRARSDGPSPDHALDRTLARIRQELDAHSLELCAKIDLPPDVARSVNTPRGPSTTAGPGTSVDLDTMVKVLTEMTSNAAKHSPPHSTVSLTCTVQDDKFVVTMVNPVHRTAGPPGARPAGASGGDLFSSGMGLGSMHARARNAGGDLEAGPVASPTGPGSAFPHGAAAEGGVTERVWRTTLRLPIVVIKS